MKRRRTARPRQVRGHALWYAHMLHRISGIALALFLPVHFQVLALALGHGEELDRALAFAELPGVKAGEFVLVFLLVVHFLGGLRVLAFEWTAWKLPQHALAALALVAALAVATLFLVQAL